MPIVEGEWYHCFNRGVDKRRIFESITDYRRFLILLYVCNTKEIIHASDFNGKKFDTVFNDPKLASKRKSTLVDIGAYSLMPNHFHLLVRSKSNHGLGLFMQKVLTGYTMYFNRKNSRTGSLFAGSFKAKHVSDDLYFRHLISYIHLNSAETIDGGWKKGKGNIDKIRKHLTNDPYSSSSYFMSRLNLDTDKATDFVGVAPKIVSDSVFDCFEEMPSVEQMLAEADEYYSLKNVKV